MFEVFLVATKNTDLADLLSIRNLAIGSLTVRNTVGYPCILRQVSVVSFARMAKEEKKIVARAMKEAAQFAQLEKGLSGICMISPLT